MINVEFVLSATAPAHFPSSQLPEIAFAGRSNVGKSSLLNSLVGRKNIAHTSSTPGKTRQINFFRVNDAFHLVDLPGYGYAKVSQTERAEWGRMIERYITDRAQLRLVVSLIDIRHDPTRLDLDLLEWLQEVERPHFIVLTKSDKIKGGEVASRVEQLHDMYGESPLLRGIEPFTIRKPELRKELLHKITRSAKVRM